MFGDAVIIKLFLTYVQASSISIFVFDPALALEIGGFTITCISIIRATWHNY